MTVPHETPGSGGYEKSDLRPKPIVVFGVILTLVTILAFVATYGMIRVLGWWEGTRVETPASPLATRTVPPEPRLQVDAPKELRSLQASEQEALTSYGWVSREARIAKGSFSRPNSRRSAFNSGTSALISSMVCTTPSQPSP